MNLSFLPAYYWTLLHVTRRNALQIEAFLSPMSAARPTCWSGLSNHSSYPSVVFSTRSNQIASDFEFRLEVYSHMLQDDMSMASTPRKIKKTIHSSISRTVGKKLAASLRDELNSGKMWVRSHMNILCLHLGRIKFYAVIICRKIRLIASSEQCPCPSSSYIWEISCSIWYMRGTHWHSG